MKRALTGLNLYANWIKKVETDDADDVDQTDDTDEVEQTDDSEPEKNESEETKNDVIADDDSDANIPNNVSPDAKIDVPTDVDKEYHDNADGSAKTGDNAQLLLISLIMVDSILATIYLILLKKKKTKER